MGCTVKVESMDLVHGRRRRHQSWKRPPFSQDGGLALQRLVVSPTVTSSFGAERQTVSLAPKWQSLLLLCLALLC